jgi:hypothetical protein
LGENCQLERAQSLARFDAQRFDSVRRASW